jgi:hypothetical protein
LGEAAPEGPVQLRPESYLLHGSVATAARREVLRSLSVVESKRRAACSGRAAADLTEKNYFAENFAIWSVTET